MIKKVEQDAVVELISDVICDVSKKSIFEDETSDGFVYLCTLTCIKISKEDIINSNYDNAIEMESSELSKEIYDKTISFLNKMGGNLPSHKENTMTDDKSEEDMN